MSSNTYTQAVASTRAVLASTSAADFDLATPCESWQVRDLVDHMVGAQHFFLAGLRGTPPSGDEAKASDGDFLASFDAATADVAACFTEEGALERTYRMPFGEMPGMAVLALASGDTFVHGWDLAKSRGLSTDLVPELAENLRAQFGMMIQPGFRGENGAAPFGPEQPAPEGASAADRLAAFLGRTV